MSEVPVPPAETDNLLNLGEGDAPDAPPMDIAGAGPTMAQQEQALMYQAPAAPPTLPPPVHEQAFVYETAVDPQQQAQVQAPPPGPPPPPVDMTINGTINPEQPQQQQQQQPPPGPPGPPPPSDAPTGEESETLKRAGDGTTEEEEGPLKKLKKEDGTAVTTKKKGRKPLHKKKHNYTMDHRGGPMPSWNDMFFALMAFKAKLGTFNVPAQTKLGKWVTKQRQEYSKLQRKKIEYYQCSELSEERIQVLDSLGFIWDTMLHENGRRWNQRFEELQQWKEEHGHCNVPQSTSLGQWVKIQRENKRESDLKAAGKLPQRTKPKPCLAPDRIAKLETIGFQWRVAAPVTGWDNRYNQLLDYAKTHNGDVNVPQYYPADKAFGRWVMKQRSEYSLRLRGLKSQLTEERVEKLNAIGFSWVAPNFKRKVGVGIAPGSPAATVAAAALQQPAAVAAGAPVVAKLPPMEKLMGEVPRPDPAAAMVQQPVPAAAAQAPPPLNDPTNPHTQAPPPLQPPPLVHHQHAPTHAPQHPGAPTMVAPPGEFPPLQQQHHDPHQQQQQQQLPNPLQQQQQHGVDPHQQHQQQEHQQHLHSHHLPPPLTGAPTTTAPDPPPPHDPPATNVNVDPNSVGNVNADPNNVNVDPNNINVDPNNVDPNNVNVDPNNVLHHQHHHHPHDPSQEPPAPHEHEAMGDDGINMEFL